MTQTPHIFVAADGTGRKCITVARSCARWITVSGARVRVLTDRFFTNYPPGVIYPDHHPRELGANVIWSSDPQEKTKTNAKTNANTRRHWAPRKMRNPDEPAVLAARLHRSARLTLSCGKWVARVTGYLRENAVEQALNKHRSP